MICCKSRKLINVDQFLRALPAILLLTLIASCDTQTPDNTFTDSGLSTVGSKEPFSSTVFPEPGILTSDSPSTFQTATFTGLQQRSTFDMRSTSFSDNEAYVYNVAFNDGYAMEAIVNAEFGSEAEARVIAQRFGQYAGQLPGVLRNHVEQLWIHKGRFLWGSVDDALIIHTDMETSYAAAGILEETLLHESVHVSLDEDYEFTPEWRAAQELDDNFISTYAKNHSLKEDLAETFTMWVAWRYLAERISADNFQKIEDAIPNRLEYLDEQGFDMNPVEQ